METEQGQNMINVALENASEYVPEIVAAKLEQIASENDIPVTNSFELILERDLYPNWDQLFLLPKNSRAWFYDGGRFWLLISDGDLFAEPLKKRGDVDSSLTSQGNAVWVITLDDAAEHLRVSQCFLSSSGHKTATRQETVKNNAMQSSEAREPDLTLTCARCGEVAALRWILANESQQEAEGKLHFLLGDGCNECQSQDWADATLYADRYLLRLIVLFLFTHLHSTKDRLALLLAVGDGIHALQREILGLPPTWGVSLEN